MGGDMPLELSLTHSMSLLFDRGIWQLGDLPAPSPMKVLWLFLSSGIAQEVIPRPYDTQEC